MEELEELAAELDSAEDEPVEEVLVAEIEEVCERLDEEEPDVEVDEVDVRDVVVPPEEVWSRT